MKNDSKPSSAPPPPHLFTKIHPHFAATTTSSPSAIKVVRRPRGRPPGSRNKPKPPLVITQDPDPTSLLMAPYVLEIPPRNDIIESVSRFCRRNGLSLLLLSASGPISNFTFRLPSPSPASSTVTFQGRFEMLSLSASFHGEDSSKVGEGVVVTVAGPQGQIVGGKVVGPLIAAGTVVVIAASFNGPTFHSLGDKGEDRGDREGGTTDGRGKGNAAVTPPPLQQQQEEGYGSSRIGTTESMFWPGHGHNLLGRQQQTPQPHF